MKRVLVTGANSYIGVSFEKYVEKNYDSEIMADTVDLLDENWRQKSFVGYDVVFHVAGIAHVDISYLDEAGKKEYYKVNTDLAIETAQKAKREGVRQFVFMSSALIYGDSAPYGQIKRITKDSMPSPTNIYGDSKWQADKGVRDLASDSFIVTVLRAPMIYGKNSKGNYPILAKMARRLIIFPNVRNERSMIYIDNLLELVTQVMIREAGGIFWPQNAEYTCTSEMVRLIAEANKHGIWVSKAWNWTILLTARIPGKIGRLTNKAFGNLVYDKELSKCDFEYRLVDLKESILRSENE